MANVSTENWGLSTDLVSSRGYLSASAWGEDFSDLCFAPIIKPIGYKSQAGRPLSCES